MHSWYGLLTIFCHKISARARIFIFFFGFRQKLCTKFCLREKGLNRWMDCGGVGAALKPEASVGSIVSIVVLILPPDDPEVVAAVSWRLNASMHRVEIHNCVP